MPPSPTESTGPQQPESNSLICQPDKGFSQQGQFDWFGLARSTVSWSVGVFARLSAAGVDQYTAVVAQNLCLLFRLGPVGRSNMHAALIELPCFRSLSDAVWFGIGTRHLLRDLAKTDQGTLCIGICASLSSCYSEDMAAEILAEVVSVSKAPVELTPSILEWKNLVHGVNGAVHMSPFPRHAERLISLFPTIQPFTAAEGISGPICSLPSSIATALLAIGDVTRNAVEAITIVGGADAGWLAAICEWLFGLHIRILLENGTLLYTGNNFQNTSNKVQVLFIYHSDNGRPPVGSSDCTEVQCLERVYYLEEATQLIKSKTGFEEGMEKMPRVSGRLSWETALSQVFRPEFKSLSGMQEVAGRAIGAAARALTAIVQNENNIYEAMWQDKHSITKWPRHSHAAHGRGFINSLTDWFPELEPWQATMEETLRSSYRDAKSIYETQISLMRSACLCNFCKDNFSANSTGQGFCKVVILETIIYLGQMLSSVSADRRLGLKRHGIEVIYDTILHNRLSTRIDMSTLHTIHGVLHFSLCYANPRQLHLEVLQLFTGETAERASYSFGTSAYSQAGICTYLHMLCELSDSKELATLIHVTPGRIEFHGCPYDYLQDGEPLAMNTRLLYRWNDDERPERLMDLDCRLKHLGSYVKPVMRVKQHVGGLKTWYEARSNKSEKILVVVQPEELANCIAISRGFVHCFGRGDCSIVIPEIEFPGPDESSTIEQLNKVICIVRGNPLMRCLAMNGTKCEYDLLRRSDECIQCCVRAALASPRERIIIVSE